MHVNWPSKFFFNAIFTSPTEFWLEQFWAEREASESVRTFASELVTGVRTHQVELDELITAYARNWTVDRMPVVDRNILRQAMYELLWIPDVPAKVTVDEALELAKIFADDETRRFVNGVLDQLIKHDARLEPKRKRSCSLNRHYSCKLHGVILAHAARPSSSVVVFGSCSGAISWRVCNQGRATDRPGLARECVPDRLTRADPEPAGI